MSDLVLASTIGMVGSIMAAAIGVLNNILGRRNQKDIKKAMGAIIILEKNTNSIKDALVLSHGKAEYARGRIEGETNPR